ncbi:MAG: S-methyl-5-thioribose-1-phosphate isomerase [Actinomycetes bacterium]
MSSVPRTIEWHNGAVVLLDQTLLPTEVKSIEITTVSVLVDAIQRLAVRGAPALGVAGALGVVLAMDQGIRESWSPTQLDEAINSIRNARPTAVNLAWAVDKVRPLVPQGRDVVFAAAQQIAAEDEAANHAMGKLGADWWLNKVGDRPLRLLTHCNTGSLATTAWGTALGVIRELAARGRIEVVFADETRPLLQGARLTAWELDQEGIPYKVLPDGAAAMAIMTGEIDGALIGADRIVSNGDSANKIGSLGVALACNAAGIPFMVVAPESTVDRSMKTGKEIHIEFRNDAEVCNFAGVRTTPLGATSYNPAFDVTPARYIAAVVTEKRVYEIAQGEDLNAGSAA